jgi:hypothetical protein
MPQTMGRGEAEDAPRRLEGQDHQRGADEQIHVARVARTLDQLGLEDPVVGRQCQRTKGQRRVAGADFREPAAALEGRVEDEGDAEQEADMQAADHQAGQRMEGRDDQLVGGEGQRDAVERGEPAVPEPALHAVLGELFLTVVGGGGLDFHQPRSRACEEIVASGPQRSAAGAQLPECTSLYMRIASTAQASIRYAQ